jgi:hypothetical protein
MPHALLFIVLMFFDMLVYSQANGLVAHWDFNGNANDITGNGNSGTVYNATLTCDRCGNSNSAYGFNGINAKIVIPNSQWIDMNNSQDFSVCYWIKTYPNPNMNTAVMSKNRNGFWSGYMFLANNTQDPGYCQMPGQLSFYTAAGWQQDACSNTAICTGTTATCESPDECKVDWKFICGIYDAATSTISLFIDGILQGDIGGISGVLSSTCNLYIGAHTDDAYFFKGALDDIRIYKKKLSQTEISGLFGEDCYRTNTNISSNINSKIKMQLSPNPATSVIDLRSEKEILSLDIIDALGNTLKNVPDLKRDQVQLDIRNLPEGIYFLKATTTSGTRILKFIKH